MIGIQNCADMNWEISQDYIQHMVYLILGVLCSECLVDWIKHCFVSKFNGIHPEVYLHILEVLRADIRKSSASKGQWLISSRRVASRVGFVPIPIASLVCKVVGSQFLNI